MYASTSYYRLLCLKKVCSPFLRSTFQKLAVRLPLYMPVMDVISCTLYDMAHSRVNDRSADEPPNQELAVFIYLPPSHPSSFFRAITGVVRRGIAKTLLRQRMEMQLAETYAPA